MTQPSRMALPVPPVGTALGDAGDAYVASLQVEILVDGRVLVTVDGTAFEEIVSAIRLRHLAFHPRNRGLLSNRMKAASFCAAIDRHWSSVDSYGPRTAGIADTVATAARTADFVGWAQAN